ncbi:hypothetical protein OIU74_024003 [Salix koriyanagi]|uniref:Uncharacterized protein n=1 Tax=Salix koriyanagi TaxID=2511006 RepID=A0A9Q0WE13_9ROSI|nr:hypothetical protein OIU74_024003 [Salix koriyanagi]
MKGCDRSKLFLLLQLPFHPPIPLLVCKGIQFMTVVVHFLPSLLIPMADLGLGPPCSAHLARRGNGSNNSLGRGAENVHGVSPPLSPVVTTSIANESLSSSSYSNSKARENNGSHSSSKVMVITTTTNKKLREEVVSLFLLSVAIAPKGKDVLSSSPSKAKENGGSKVPIKEVIPEHEKPVVQNLNEVPSWSDTNEVQGSSINEPLDEQQFDPMQMESNVDE